MTARVNASDFFTIEQSCDHTPAAHRNKYQTHPCEYTAPTALPQISKVIQQWSS